MKHTVLALPRLQKVMLVPRVTRLKHSLISFQLRMDKIIEVCHRSGAQVNRTG